MALRGAHVIFTARNLDKGIEVQNKLRVKTKNQSITYEYLDLEDLKSVQSFASAFNKEIHILVINAGIFYHPPKKTVDNFETTFQTNYLGESSLVLLLSIAHSSIAISCNILFFQVNFFLLSFFCHVSDEKAE